MAGDILAHHLDVPIVSLINFVCNCHYTLSPTAVDGDPHFMIELPDRDDALCFNINDKPGTILNLVKDPESGILLIGKV